MISAVFTRRPGWLPALIVLAFVLVSGGRVIVLGMQQHAVAARADAAARASAAARSLERELRVLADRASRQQRPDSSLRDAFWILPSGTALPSRHASTAIVNGLMAEWSLPAPIRGRRPLPQILGPTRQGSQWIVAAIVPILGPDGDRTAETGWSVSYGDVERMLAALAPDRLKAAGYVFELREITTNGAVRPISSAGSLPLSDPSAQPIRLPDGFAAQNPGEELQIALQPQVGWYPQGVIAAQVGLLAVLAWLLAFGAHDLAHHMQRLRAGVDLYRRRIRALQQTLTREIEQRQSLQRSVDHARYHDGFTGLPNRRYFTDQLDRALREVRTRRRPRLGVILLDIARFKLINDTLGPIAGDELMVQAARRFSHTTASLDCVLARWGGDQFAVLLLDVASEEAALAFASMLHKTLGEPFQLRRHRLSVWATVGITICAGGGAQRVEDVLREADIALSAAKRSETHKTMLYAASMGGAAASLVSLEADLHVALANNELRLLFQPIVRLRDRCMVGAEVLLRWQHPVEGLLTPDKFLGIAEEAGLMVTMTQRIIMRVCKLASLWSELLPAEQSFYFSVNLSASVLRDPDFSGFVERTLATEHVPPSKLKFEVTEATMISNVGATREAFEALHRQGVQLMLDDFGTGFSSINYLQLFPLDYVKIDRPFLSRDVSDRANSGMMAAILQMTPSLGMTAIAEVVETQAAAEALVAMGCEYGQGYYFSAPVRAEQALRYLRGEPFAPPETAAADLSQTRELPVIDPGATIVLPPIDLTRDADEGRDAAPRVAASE